MIARNPDANASELADGVVGVIRELAAELRGGRAPEVALDSRLDRELGFDSLARLELLLRLQRRLGVSLSEERALAAETPRELVAALSAVGGTRAAALTTSCTRTRGAWRRACYAGT